MTVYRGCRLPYTTDRGVAKGSSSREGWSLMGTTTTAIETKRTRQTDRTRIRGTKEEGYVRGTYLSSSLKEKIEPKEATREKKIRWQKSKREPEETAARLPSFLLQSWRGLLRTHPDVPRGLWGQSPFAHHLNLPHTFLAERTPGGRKKPRTIILLTAGSSSQLISIPRWALSR